MIVRMLFVAAAALIPPLSAPSSAGELTERLKFWDDGPQDASFVKFRNELKETIARKDASKLFAILASDIKIDFGGFGGGPEFHKMWKPYDKDSKVWAALSLVVEQGGNFDSPARFSAPYVYSAFPSDVDGLDKVVVTKEGAVMRAHPNVQGPIIRKLDHDILTVVGTAQDDVVDGQFPPPQHECSPRMWVIVKDAKGVGGCVPACDVRSPIDYRAYFEKRKGKWVLVTFIAGD